MLSPRNRLSAVLATGALAVGIAACGDDTSGAQEETATTTEGASTSESPGEVTSEGSGSDPSLDEDLRGGDVNGTAPPGEDEPDSGDSSP
jgi:hypothetical protein